MGARTQIKIKQGKKSVYLYSHYDSEGILGITRNGLIRAKERWNDEEYLSRILFCELIQNDVKGILGYGIGTSKHGDLDNMVTIDPANQTISFESGYSDQKGFKDMKLEDFVK